MKRSRHGGNVRLYSDTSGLPQKDILDFSANINPLAPPSWFRSVVSRSLEDIGDYPDPDCVPLVNAVSARWGVAADEITIGNGASEILYLLPRALDVRHALVPVPAYVDYAEACRASGLAVRYLPSREEDDFSLDFSLLDATLEGTEVVFMARPNNPTGLVFDSDSLLKLAGRHQDTVFVVDEAFTDFVPDMKSLAGDRPENLIVLVSLTKIFGIPGLRLGLAMANREITAKLQAIKPPWSVNTIAQAVGEAALKDEEFLARSVRYVSEQREWLHSQIKSMTGMKVFEGLANFLLIRSDRPDMNGAKLFQALLEQGIAIRVCDNYEGLDSRYFRVAVRTEAENRRLVNSLRACLDEGPSLTTRKITPAIMFQGLGSNAGKSVLTAALCRILFQDGYRVFPFKAQNMSLNSFVTVQGEEMGRAQVLQAQACCQAPDVRMNPVLLKPGSDTGCQVIVDGKPAGNMDVAEYVRYKPQAFERVKAAYDSLAARADCLVLEGAGSPAEINLKHHDIVNMKMADYAEAAVLLVGDIDRGGVFSSYVGTMEVLDRWERDLIAGFVINRFRGDAGLLTPALEYTENHTGRPVLGVVPFIENLGLPEEDSVEFKSGALDPPQPDVQAVEIAVVDLPHISNFTDFDPFRLEPDVFLRIVRSAADLGHPDAVILPGSKNVPRDLMYLREQGLDKKIIELAKEGLTEVVGICAGFQMIGKEIQDPERIESDLRQISGLNLLPITTTLEQDKTLTYTDALHLSSGLRIHGYEIHHGRSDTSGLPGLIRRTDGTVIGAGQEQGRVWGTYLHGLFDADEFRRWFIDRLRQQRGLEPKGTVQVVYDVNKALDRLADIVRECLPIDRIYRLMGLL